LKADRLKRLESYLEYRAVEVMCSKSGYGEEGGLHGVHRIYSMGD
jgi:hypothetical protein